MFFVHLLLPSGAHTAVPIEAIKNVEPSGNVDFTWVYCRNAPCVLTVVPYDILREYLHIMARRHDLTLQPGVLPE